MAPDQHEPQLPDEDQPSAHAVELTVMAWTIRAGYSVIDRLGIQLRMPVRMSIVGAGFDGPDGEPLSDAIESIHHRDEVLAGVGDLELRMLGGVLRPGQLGDLLVDVGLGLVFPTGGVEEDPFERGRQGLEHQHIFFGGGTFRPTVSLNATYAFEAVTLSLFGDAELSLYSSGNYQPPSIISTGFGAYTGFGLTSWRFLLQQEFFHEVAARWGDEPAENSGRSDLVATVGAAWLATRTFQISLLVRVPYYTFGADDPIKIPAIVSLSFTANLDTQE